MGIYVGIFRDYLRACAYWLWLRVREQDVSDLFAFNNPIKVVHVILHKSTNAAK